MVPANKIVIKTTEDGRRYKCIEGMSPEGKLVNRCPFCDGWVSSGSWSPEVCEDCGAVYFFGAWTLDIE